jgi:hypothetical protein
LHNKSLDEVNFSSHFSINIIDFMEDGLTRILEMSQDIRKENPLMKSNPYGPVLEEYRKMIEEATERMCKIRDGEKISIQ